MEDKETNGSHLNGGPAQDDSMSSAKDAQAHAASVNIVTRY